MSQSIRDAVVTEIAELLEEDGKPVPELTDSAVLLESGLDSLGFAVLVTRLEESLGYDPFTIMEEAIYPRTLAEFVAIYVRYQP